ncbi:MAG: recombination mediator RecR [Rhodospirillaceae bacterium]|nr:recombination mediator RecR [Rhodospirillaceae bacterium]
MAQGDIEKLIQLLAKLPGLGPRSARRAALHLLKKRETLMQPLARALEETARSVRSCGSCGNLDSIDPCAICTDARRDVSIVCVVEEVGDLWAMERSASYRGLYHVLGGRLSALDGVGPDDLRVAGLVARAQNGSTKEIIIATSATVDGQTTAHYLQDRLTDAGVEMTRLAHGVPVGGELDFLDDGTIMTALKARRPV